MSKVCVRLEMAARQVSSRVVHIMLDCTNAILAVDTPAAETHVFHHHGIRYSRIQMSISHGSVHNVFLVFID